MAFRNEGVAARERVKALEEEVARLKADNEELRSRSADELKPRRGWWGGGLFVFAGVLMGGAAYAGAALDNSIVAVALLNVALLTFAAAAAVMVMSRLMHVVPPNKLLIVSGRTRRQADGVTVGYRAVSGGRTFRLPIIERADELDVTNHIVEDELHEVRVTGGAIDVAFVANVKLASSEPRLRNAVERFMGKSRAHINRVAKETIGAAVREALVPVPAELLHDDPEQVRNRVIEQLGDDFDHLGLELDTIKLTA